MRTSYFLGRDPSSWHTDVPSYGRVRYRGVYDGVDLVYYSGTDGRPEYDFVVAPGADPSLVRMRFEGAESISVDETGALVRPDEAVRIVEIDRTEAATRGRVRYRIENVSGVDLPDLV